MSTMFHKISLIALLVFVSLQEGNTQALCRPKIILPPLPVSPLALPASLFNLQCAEPSCNCGPDPLPLPIIQAPPVTVPTIEGPIIPLPSPPIPCPRTIAHRCVCTKTVVKPQLIQRCITIPSIQRYLKRTYTPVVENIAYKAKPRCAPCSCGGRGGACTCGARAAAPVCTCGARAPPPAPACAPPPVPLSLPYSRIC